MEYGVYTECTDIDPMFLSIALPPEIQDVIDDDFDSYSDEIVPAPPSGDNAQSEDAEEDGAKKKEIKDVIPLFNPLMRFTFFCSFHLLSI